MSPVELSRRRFLQGTAAAACLAGAAPLVHPMLAFGQHGALAGDTLVLVILRGGLDGLSLLVPVDEGNYYNSRPRTAIPALTAPVLNDQFRLHPAAAPLLDVWRGGHLAFVPACGSLSDSRSHFVQQGILDGGVLDRIGGTGWLARHLASRPGGSPSALQAATIATTMSPALIGSMNSLAVPHLATTGLFGDLAPDSTQFQAALARLAGSGGPWATSAAAASATLDVLAAAQPASVPVANGAHYLADAPSDKLRQVAQLIRADVGLEAAVIDLNGFDTHNAMGTAAGGQIRELLVSLAGALAAFYVDTLSVADRVTTVVVSEFGRRVAENSSGGTDHGRGGIAMVMGGNVRGGVYGSWPGLSPDALDRGDVQVTTDFRNVLGEVVQHRLGNGNLGEVFPGLAPSFLGLVNPR